MYKLLLAGQSIELAIPVLGLFRRAGFTIDYMSPSKRLRGHPLIAEYLQLSTIEDLPAQLVQRTKETIYDQVIVTDDVSLALIKNADLSETLKLQILPITSIEACAHLTSKVGLSDCLSASGIPTPAYRVIRDPRELLPVSKEMGYPLLLKGDRSGGGTQVVKITGDADVAKLLRYFTYFPAVLQRYIEGDLIGIEAYYQRESLVFFNYAKVLSNVRSEEFTPSIFRRYLDNSSLGSVVFEELAQLGRALRANGFVNITALYDSSVQQHYYVEADMRPTVWVDHAKYWGKDDAAAIRLAMQGQTTPCAPQLNLPLNRIIAYPVRMSMIGLMLNRGLAWQQIRNEPYFFKLILRNGRHQFLAYLNLRAVRQWFKKNWTLRKHING
jgi:hypothetical protein